MSGKVKSSMSLFIVAAMMFIFAGCGGGNNAVGNNSAATPPGSNQTTQKAAENVKLTISAAASLTDALKEIQRAYESVHQNVKLNFNFGSSGALQQQIEQGAPADLFLAAAPKNMKALVDKQLVDPDKQLNLLSNELVVVIAADGKTVIESAEDLLKAKKVAIGIPESVPAGNYAKEALLNANLWDALQAQMVQGKDVRQVLQYVETGNADAGYVYKTDALTSRKVKVAFAADPATYTPIEYPVGIIKASKHGMEAEKFYTYLQSREALDIFAKYGFSIPE